MAEDASTSPVPVGQSSTPRDLEGALDQTDIGERNTSSRLANKSWTFLSKLNYVPPRCRWDDEKPGVLSWTHCLLFSFAAAFTVSNLYYSHPILDILAEDFDVTAETISRIPTLMQAGYAAGLLFICPLADILRLRSLVLLLVFITANVWLGLCITRSFALFQALSFLAAVTTVTPQVILPLVAQLAPAARRATMISIVSGGLFMGVLLARIISGIITEYASWRIVYFMSFGLQYLILILLYVFLPDYPPSTNDITYHRILYTIITIPLRQPLLVQTSVMAFFVGAVFVSYWTTLTFLLAAAPFNLSTLSIGLFALVGMPPFLVNPVMSRYITDRYHPSYGAILAILIAMVGVLVGTFVGTFSLAGPVVQGLLVDLGLIMQQTASRAQLAAVEPEARNRVNTVFTASTFCGMLMGTAVGNKLYNQGGWHYSGGASVAFLGVALIFAFARGPYEEGWLGWSGGWDWRGDSRREE